MTISVETWQIIVGLAVCLAVGIIGTIVAKNGWESKILGVWESMKVVYSKLRDFVVEHDEQLAVELDAMFATLEEAFADGGLTLAEFNAIRKDFLPLWNRFLEWIESVKASGVLTE